MATLSFESNPVLIRELRANLRNARAFGLLALYIALLGAVVTANFPGNAAIDLQSDGGARGQELFYWLFGGQVALILAILPALSTGALAQERERQTLQPLILTPLSPLQIVWGKAGGVLSLVGLMLLATLPLTSLCFLLGGVDTGMLVAAYSAILGLAVFTTGFGLYCSARWQSATRALMTCYALLPIVIALVMVALPLGALFSGLFCLFLLFYGLVQLFQKGREAPLAKRFGRVYGSAIYGATPLIFLGLLWLMWADRNIGLIVIGIGFVLSYFVMVTQWGLLQTARELMTRVDPEASARQKVEEFKEDWRAAAATPIYLPGDAATAPASATSTGEWATIDTAPKAASQPEIAPTPAPVLNKKAAATYGVTPFLSDKMNPIYARELRSGLLGKFQYLFKFGYGITLLSEIGLLIFLLAGLWNSNWLVVDLTGPFVLWGRLHLVLLMIFAAWFCARAIAPEREGQTLAQLFTIPLPASKIVGGKMGAVLTFTLYVWILAVPLALLCGMLDLVPWKLALRFISAEVVLGLAAASWGLYCSFHSDTVRRALAMSLGGVAALLAAHTLVAPLWNLLVTLKVVGGAEGAQFWRGLFPISLVFGPNATNMGSGLSVVGNSNSTVAYPLLPWPLVIYLILAVVLLALTARDFQKLARES